METEFKSYEEAEEYFDGIEDKAKVLSLKPFKSSEEYKQLAFFKSDITLKEQKEFEEKYKEASQNSSFFGKEKRRFVDVGEKEDKFDIFSKRGQIEIFWSKQPFFYDKSKMFWIWDNKYKKWNLSDEIDFLNSIENVLGVETINNKTRTELVAGFKQVGRKHMPKEFKKSWIQFKNKIYDVKTGKILDATPEYFSTNPIPWGIGESEDTPIIDKYFKEWVGEENKQILYEFLAYNMSLDKFMQRLFAFCGGGSNGKGTLIKLNYKFLGKENCVSSEIKALSEDRFEPAVLYRKLLCVMGEVSYSDLRNTNQLKKLGGEDLMSFQFKGKTPFSEENTATCVCLTNALPTTPDKSTGFYRKWLIVDFPNEFPQINKDLIGEISDIEFENLAKKCLNILKELYNLNKFYNEGDFEERRKRYEERSNPVMRFIEEFCEEVAGENMTIREFTNLCNDYLKNKHLRIMTARQVGIALREEGFIVSRRKSEDISSVVILNLKYKIPELPELPKDELDVYIGTDRDLDSLGSLDGKKKEILNLYEEQGLGEEAKKILNKQEGKK